MPTTRASSSSGWDPEPWSLLRSTASGRNPQPLHIPVEGRLGEPEALPGGLHTVAVLLQPREDQLTLEVPTRVSQRRPRLFQLGVDWQ